MSTPDQPKNAAEAGQQPTADGQLAKVVAIAPRKDDPAPLIGQQVAWDRDRLVITDEKALRKVDRKRLSASSMAALNSCPGRWAIERLMPSLPDPFGAAEIGTSGHKLLEVLFGLPSKMRTPETADRLLETLAERYHDELDVPDLSEAKAMARWRADVTKAVHGLWQIEDPSTVQVAATELQLNTVEVGGVPFVGFIDRSDFEQLDNGRSGRRIVDYKGLALDTKLPTPDGWTTMGDAREGDMLLGADGLPTKIIGKSSVHHRPCYVFKFSDGTNVVCDNVHLWNITESVSRPSHHLVTKTMNADEVYTAYRRVCNEGHSKSLFIENTEPLRLRKRKLPIDPWLLGAWLGDGISKSGSIVVGNEDLNDTLTIIRDKWSGRVAVHADSATVSTVSLLSPHPERCPQGHQDWSYYQRKHSVQRACKECGRNRYHRIPKTMINVPLAHLLRQSGLRLNKHVPFEYLRASASQRLLLLQGLMDTDGSFNTHRKRAVFVTTNKLLSDAVAELVLSLGCTAQRFTVRKRQKKSHSISYRVEFRPVGFNPFLLPRKARKAEAAAMRGTGQYSTARATRRTLVSVEKTTSVPTQCVMVDAPDSLYLCGPTLIPTHNTGRYKKPNPRFGDEKGDQLRLYTLATSALDGRKPTSAHLYFTKVGKKVTVDIRDSELRRTEREFTRTWRDLKSHVRESAMPCKASPLCGWCPLATVCPVAQKAGKDNARVPGATAGEAMDIPVLTPITRFTAGVSGFDEDGIEHCNDDSDFDPRDSSDGDEDADADADAAADRDPVADPDDEQDRAADDDGWDDEAEKPELPAEQRDATEAEKGSATDVDADGGQGAEADVFDPDEADDEAEVMADAAGYDPADDFGDGDPRPNGAGRAAKDQVEGEAVTDPDGPSSCQADADDSPEAGPDSDSTPNEGDADMAKWAEDKVWEETNHDGKLNPNSYASIAVFGLTSMAVEELHKAERPVTGKAVRALTNTLALTLADAQEELSGRTSFQDGLNTRLRGALRTTVETMPLPFGLGPEDWESWVAKATKRLVSIAKVALDLWDDGADSDAPWMDIAS